MRRIWILATYSAANIPAQNVVKSIRKLKPYSLWLRATTIPRLRHVLETKEASSSGNLTDLLRPTRDSFCGHSIWLNCGSSYHESEMLRTDRTRILQDQANSTTDVGVSSATANVPYALKESGSASRAIIRTSTGRPPGTIPARMARNWSKLAELLRI